MARRSDSPLIMEQGVTYWRRYLAAFVLMGAAAGHRGLGLHSGSGNQSAYVEKNVRGIAILSAVTVLLLFIKGWRPTAIP